MAWLPVGPLELYLLAQAHGVSGQTIYGWRQKHGTLVSDEVRRLRQLEQENNRLKKLLAERDLEIEVMKEINAKKVVSVPERCQQIGYARSRGLSARCACWLMHVECATA